MTTGYMICAESQPIRNAVLDNWSKTSDKLGFKRLTADHMSHLVLSLQGTIDVSHMWIDYSLLDRQKPIEEFFNLKTTIETVSKMSGKKTPGLVLVVDHTIPILQLKLLVDSDQVSVVVDSDLKIKHIFETCITKLIFDKIYFSPSVSDLLNDRPARFVKQEFPKIHVSWLMPSISRTITAETIQKLTVDFRLRVNTFETVSSLVKNLATPNYRTDYVFVDIDLVCSTITNVLDAVQCFKTLPVMAGSGDTCGVYAAVSNNTKIETIRQLLQNPGIDGLVPILGDKFEYLHLQLAVYHVLNQSYHIPAPIKDKLDCKKKPALKQELGLTDRQKEIFELISDKGASNKVIANRLKITEGAVKSHVGKLLKKFGLRNRTELAALST